MIESLLMVKEHENNCGNQKVTVDHLSIIFK